MSQEHQGSFLGGLAVGLFAGAAGYFLFATKDGEQMRKKVEHEWQSAKESLAKDGIIANKDASLSSMISDWLGMAEPKTQSKKKSARTGTNKSAKFKGV